MPPDRLDEHEPAREQRRPSKPRLVARVGVGVAVIVPTMVMAMGVLAVHRRVGSGTMHAGYLGASSRRERLLVYSGRLRQARLCDSVARKAQAQSTLRAGLAVFGRL